MTCQDTLLCFCLLLQAFSASGKKSVRISTYYYTHGPVTTRSMRQHDRIKAKTRYHRLNEGYFIISTLCSSTAYVLPCAPKVSPTHSNLLLACPEHIPSHVTELQKLL